MTSAVSLFDAVRSVRGHGSAIQTTGAAARQELRSLTTVGSVTRFGIASTVSEFEALRADWERLEERCGSDTGLFQRFAWLSLWCKHFVAPDSASLCVVTVQRDGELVCALPLVVETAFGLRQLTIMGAPVSQYSDALVIEGADRNAYLRQAWTIALEHARPSVVRLVKVRADAAIAQFLATNGAIETSREAAPYIALEKFEGRSDYWARFSGKKLKNLRRLKRRLEERGACSFKWTLEGKAAADAVGLMMVLKRAWLRDRGLVSKAFSDGRFEAFFAEAAQQRQATGVEIATLGTAGETANALLSVEYKGRLALHVIAYSMKHERSSAGTLHIEAMINEAFRRGVRVVDFLAPHQEYKKEWADDAVRVSDFAVPVTVAGRIYTRGYLQVVREGLKLAAGMAPVSIMRRVSMMMGRG